MLYSLENGAASFGLKINTGKTMSVSIVNSSLPNSRKVRIFKSNAVSVLLYGSSTWKVTKPIITEFQVFVNRCLRSIFHIYWSNTISNVNLLKMAALHPQI